VCRLLNAAGGITIPSVCLASADWHRTRPRRHIRDRTRAATGAIFMCRNIKTLANFEPPATDDEIHASALQFVRKLSGTTRPSRANETAFNQAVDDVTAIARRLIHSLDIHAPPRNREEEARKAHERARQRFA
jgi:hypothetical protein